MNKQSNTGAKALDADFFLFWYFFASAYGFKSNPLFQKSSRIEEDQRLQSNSEGFNFVNTPKLSLG